MRIFTSECSSCEKKDVLVVSIPFSDPWGLMAAFFLCHKCLIIAYNDFVRLLR